MNKGKNKGGNKVNAPKAKGGDADAAGDKKGKAGARSQASKVAQENQTVVQSVFTTCR